MKETMRVAVLATGGKDSTLALHRVLEQGYDVEYLATLLPLTKDSWMFHTPNLHLIDLFSESVEIPLAKAQTCGIKEKEVADLKHLIERLDVEGIVSGAIASNYQKNRIQKVCDELGLKSVMPLWNEDQQKILNDILRLKLEVVITGVYARGFNEEWLGRKIEEETVKALIELYERYGVSIAGEGGEYETLVLNAPFFKKRIRIVEAEKTWDNESGQLLIKRARLEESVDEP